MKGLLALALAGMFSASAYGQFNVPVRIPGGFNIRSIAPGRAVVPPVPRINPARTIPPVQFRPPVGGGSLGPVGGGSLGPVGRGPWSVGGGRNFPGPSVGVRIPQFGNVWVGNGGRVNINTRYFWGRF